MEVMEVMSYKFREAIHWILSSMRAGAASALLCYSLAVGTGLGI